MGDPINDRETYTIIPTNRLFTTTSCRNMWLIAKTLHDKLKWHFVKLAQNSKQV